MNGLWSSQMSLLVCKITYSRWLPIDGAQFDNEYRNAIASGCIVFTIILELC